MKIEKLKPNKVKITLSCTEILQMNSDSHPVEASKLVHTLLQTLDSEYQFPLFNHKVLLETVPSQEDGFYIYLTTLPSDTETKEETNDILIVAIERKETVTNALKLLEFRFLKQCVLYLLDEMYYLVIHSIQSIHQRIQIRLSDLGECIKNPTIFETVLLEYASVIADGKALQTLL